MNAATMARAAWARGKVPIERIGAALVIILAAGADHSGREPGVGGWAGTAMVIMGLGYVAAIVSATMELPPRRAVLLFPAAAAALWLAYCVLWALVTAGA